MYLGFTFIVITCEVGGVGGYHDEGEEPPHTSNHSGRDRPEHQRGQQQQQQEMFT